MSEPNDNHVISTSGTAGHPLRWDHTVHYVNNLDEAIDTFQQYGLHAFRGGSHPKWGTYNALSYFGLEYVEFLGIEDRDKVQAADPSHVVVRDALTELPVYQRFSRVAIRTDDIDAVWQSLQQHELQVSDILDGERRDASGHLIQWRMFMIGGDFEGLPYPFFIQWSGDDEQRLDQLTRTGLVAPHPAGDTELLSALFGVVNPEAAATHWHELFGLEKEQSAPNTLRIGKHYFSFVQAVEPGITALTFRTHAESLLARAIEIGGGQYRFIASEVELDSL
ncbi:VOC family protein [Paenibacillus sp. WLX2291]|uniref:VOC family protein n=1 Tax=Paenibacillus sp. WLX2291 TaxID=3296934 RepID=UPI003984018D